MKDILAFPRAMGVTDNCDWQIHDYGEEGMTLRDYFASKAPSMPEQWWLDTPKIKEDGSYVHVAEAIASWNYFYAECMLKEREKHAR